MPRQSPSATRRAASLHTSVLAHDAARVVGAWSRKLACPKLVAGVRHKTTEGRIFPHHCWDVLGAADPGLQNLASFHHDNHVQQPQTYANISGKAVRI